MQKGVNQLFLLIGIVLICSSCVKTTEKIFTPYNECSALKAQDNPDEMRDKYDSCLMLQDEDLKTDSVCKKKCEAYCTKNEWNYEDIYIDFTGCHCFCKVTYKR
jgi:hypothetical protein